MIREKNFKLAQQMVKRRQYFDAMDRFRQLLQTNNLIFPDVASLLYKHLRLDFDNLHLRIMLSDLYLLNYDYGSAIEELEDAFQIDPHFTQIYFLLSKIYTRNPREKHRIKAIFESAFSQGVHDSAILDLLPKIYLEDHDLEKSISMYEQLSQNRPESISYKKTLLELYIQHHDYVQALQIMVDISKLFPDSTQDLVRKAEALCENVNTDIAHHELLTELNIQGMNPVAASRHVKRIIMLDPAQIDVCIFKFQDLLTLFPDTKQILLNLAEAYIENEQLTEAVTTLRRIITHCAEGDEIVMNMLENITHNFPAHFSSRELLTELYIQNDYYEQAYILIRGLQDNGEVPLDALLHLISLLVERAPTYVHKCDLLRANLYLSNLQYPDALDACHRLFGTDYELEGRLLISETKLLDGLYDQARHALLPALESSPHDNSIHHLLNLIYIAEEKELGKRHSTPALENSSEELYVRGLEFMRHSKFYDAIEQFQKVAPKSRHHHNAQFLLGRCFLESGRFELCINQFLRVLKHSTQESPALSHHARYFLGITYELYGHINDAISQFEAIAADNFQFPNVEHIISHLKSRSTLDIRGRGLSGIFYIPRSVYFTMDVENIENHGNLNPHQRIGLANGHNNDAVHAALNQNWKSAEDAFRLSMQLDPEYTIAYSNLAYVLAQDHRLSEAIEILETAENLNPNLDTIYLQKALVKFRQGQYEHARRELDTAISINPLNAIAHINLGVLHSFNTKHDLAFECFDHALNLQPQLFFLVKRAIPHLLPPHSEFSRWMMDISFTTSDIFPKSNLDTAHQQSLFEEQGSLF